ncbi:MAG TPA: dienelactone hydrolase family protein [Amaricoccus sp.]|nr:dienelactone hydrolase family protein [Amaricoccus sp.]
MEAFGVRAEVEVYPADHGWMPPDAARHDEAQAERGWARLLALLQGSLA